MTLPRTFTVALALGGLLTGCGAPYWQAANGTVWSFRTDRDECIEKAKTRFDPVTLKTVADDASEGIYRACGLAGGNASGRTTRTLATSGVPRA